MRKFNVKKLCAKIFLWKALFILPSLALAHLISITPIIPFYNTVLAGTTSIAVYKVTNISQISLDGIGDQSILPSSMRVLPSSTCSVSSPLAAGASCTIQVGLTAPNSATQITGAQLREWAAPSLDGVIYNIPAITIGTQLLWTWMSGDNVTNQPGVYGTKGVAAADNKPGARGSGVSWIDTNNNLWLFGGRGYDSTGTEGRLNDLWKFDGTQWTWMSGSDQINKKGIYGAKGIAAADNVPGARIGSVSWIDAHGNLWLFGGFGLDSDGNEGNLNDLWKFDGSSWTWVSGGNIMDQAGSYGIKGTPSGTNIPGSRRYGVSWIDSNGNFWLFGGYGCDSTTTCITSTQGYLNDLWKFDGTNWTWVGGSNGINHAGSYSGSNSMPGARVNSVSWIDHNGNFWLFGGQGYDSSNNLGNLNDLWKFDGTNWIWIKGSNVVNQSGVYGTKGTGSTANIPGARGNSISWIDSSNNLWLFGGLGYDSIGSKNNLNDLWKFDGTNWIWISGSNTVNHSGNYGDKGAAANSNMPGARGASYTAMSWIDSNGNLFLFGGNGLDTGTEEGRLNDLWKLSVN